MTQPTVPAPMLRRFPKMRQDRGSRIFEQGQVDLLDVQGNGDETVLVGFVDDPKRFRTRRQTAVYLHGQSGIETDCSCMGPPGCEHAFGLLLAYLDEDLEDDFEEDIEEGHAIGLAEGPATRDAEPTWQDRLRQLPPPAVDGAGLATETDAAGDAPAPAPLHFCIDRLLSSHLGELVLVALVEEQGDEGARMSAFGRDTLLPPLDATGRRTLQLLEQLDAHDELGSGKSVFRVPSSCTDLVLGLIRENGRVLYRDANEEGAPIRVLEPTSGEPHRFAVRQRDVDGHVEVHAELCRGDEVLQPDLLLPQGFAVADQRLLRVAIGAAWPLVRTLVNGGPLRAASQETTQLLGEVVKHTAHDPLCQPPASVRTASTPTPVLVVHMRKAMQKHVPCELMFDYDGALAEVDGDPLLPSPDGDGSLLQRVLAEELEMLQRIRDRHADVLEPTGMESCFTLAKKRLDGSLTKLVQSDLRVLIDGKPVLPSTGVKVHVASGIDWFDVRGEIRFADGSSAPLAAALLAAKRGSQMIELGEGRRGMLPERLIEMWAVVLDLGEAHDKGVRVPRGQALLLDALLASRDTELAADEAFTTWRERLAGFAGVAARREPDAFAGELRDYQRFGLGWLHFLRELGLGGCLADDMGLGKTVQVLALLADVHGDHDRAPSLLVVPRSLLDNWRNEAARFTPSLRVLDFSGPTRWAAGEQPFDGHDLVLTTYGTLRGDIEKLDELGVRFEYAILDEAQAISNPQSITFKAARLLRAQHRLALTGTPVQNHIGELWALFEFLSPGLLGRSSAFRRLVGNVRGQDVGMPIDDVRRGLAPFLLRRTKEQVLAELPEKQEQTLFCDLGKPQRRAYDALRVHYRDALIHGTDTLSNRERFLALEALLRLRQAACHEGLLDPKRVDSESAKLDVLVPMLEEIAASGHKALVFSQFTKLLGILRRQLEQRNLVHEYLDGRTRKRQPKVDRFQSDPTCSAFLISLKAGGVGLNLTAADYVFLLDPWWNPAAEAQAVDRAHRIGQTNKVVAYRLVARDTVEERVLQLQQKKRELADALLGDNASMLAELDRDQLATLLE